MNTYKLVKVSKDECKLLYIWVNDLEVRRNSFDTREISYIEHEKWFYNKIKDKDTNIYIFKINKTPIGVIRLDRINQNSFLINYSIDSNFRGKGYATKLLSIIKERFREDLLIGKVKIDNIGSIKAFKKAGYIMKKKLDYLEFHSKTKKEVETLREIKKDKVYIVAEISANHGHHIQTAKDTIKAIKDAGADAVKIQTYTADTITMDCDNEYFQVNQGTLWDGTTLYKLYQQAYTPWEWHEELFEYAKKIGITIFSSPFDKTAVDLLEKLNTPIYKIASFEITDIPLIKYIASKGKPIIISTGIATIGEIKEAIDTCKSEGNSDITLLKCTSSYPAPYEEMNLLTIPNMKDTFDVEVGLSDHSMGSTVAIGAVAIGASVIEKHVILDRNIGGPDAEFSMVIDEFKSMVKEIRILEKALGKVNYDLTEKAIKNRTFSRSLFFTEDIKQGEKITEDNMRSIRPGYGMHPRHYEEIIGKKTTKDIKKGTPVSWSYIG